MSFLTPLYLAGLAAVALPIIFHLIRRMPRGRISFSSLMFLSPSPPRLTRKSRLNHVLLLVLRAVALILLALAFTRPFQRESAKAMEPAGARNVAILLDTSASMRREGCWRLAVEAVDRVLEGLEPADDAALFAFDRTTRVVVPFRDRGAGGPPSQVDRIRNGVRGLSPTWSSSSIGEALVIAADALDAVRDAKEEAADIRRELVLVSDLGEGSSLDALGAYEWPGDVRVAVKKVTPARPGNAGIAVLGTDEEPGEESLRVRVTNDRASTVDELELRWATGDDRVPGVETRRLYVPAGESRTIAVTRPPAGVAADRLTLRGDEHPFDNTYFLAPPDREEVVIVYVGTAASDDANGLRYYLERALLDTPRRAVRVVSDNQGGADPGAARLIVMGDPVPPERIAPLRAGLRGGKTILLVLTDPSAGATLAGLLEREVACAEEDLRGTYAMLGDIDFSHPLLAPFADPRFSDFTKIRFWRHRRLDLAAVPDARIVARFDDGAPALVDFRLGEGTLLVLTSGWHPADSQLARSTKFVPLLAGVLDRARAGEEILPSYEVGDRVPLPAASAGSLTVIKPDGTRYAPARDSRHIEDTDQPGVYTLTWPGGERRFAVNLAPDESRTAPLAVEELERRGVLLGRPPPSAAALERQRQLRDMELENRQKWWRWLLAAALGVLVTETWLAGFLTRPPADDRMESDQVESVR